MQVSNIVSIIDTMLVKDRIPYNLHNTGEIMIMQMRVKCQDLSFCLVVFRILCPVLSQYVHSSFILALMFPSNVPVFMFTLYFHSPSRPHTFDCFQVKWFPYYLPSALI